LNGIRKHKKEKEYSRASLIKILSPERSSSKGKIQISPEVKILQLKLTLIHPRHEAQLNQEALCRHIIKQAEVKAFTLYFER